MAFLFRVNVCVSIIMMLSIVENFQQFSKNRYTGEWVIFFCLGFYVAVLSRSKTHYSQMTRFEKFSFCSGGKF